MEIGEFILFGLYLGAVAHVLLIFVLVVLVFLLIPRAILWLSRWR